MYFTNVQVRVVQVIASDIVLELKAITDDEQNAKMFIDFHEILGLCQVKKLRHLNSIVPYFLSTDTFAMRMKRRVLTFETLELPPVSILC